MLFGVGIVLRVLSEAPAGLLQVRGRIAMDNLLVAVAEIVWAMGTTVSFLTDTAELVVVGTWFLMANLVLLAARGILGRMEVRALTSNAAGFDRAIAWQLLSFGVLVAFAQLADFLYAPVDYILINRFIDPAAVAVYAPAVQIDGGLLLLVVAVSTVLLPKTAVAHAAGDVALVRRYYVRATLLTGGILLAAAVAVWLLSRWIFRFWLGDDMPETRAILPLVLIHTVVGGSSAVGRSILLGIGKVKPFTIAVLTTGVANVVLGYVFVRYLNLGLRGIVYATVIVVVARAGLWMPWYVVRTLRQMETQPATPSRWRTGRDEVRCCGWACSTNCPNTAV
jgi:O-antigen/teichoic acid export membrane protein